MLRYRLKEVVADREFQAGRRITIREIADETDTNRSTLSKMANERGAVIRTDVIDRVCNYLGCSIDELVEHIADPGAPSFRKPARAESSGDPGADGG